MSATTAKPLDISIIGETNLDLILYGLPETMPLERELLGTDFRLTLGGSSSILAHNLATLGSRVGFSSLVGDDEMGHIALDRLREAGVDTSHVLTRSGQRSGVTLLLPHGRQRHILTYAGVMADLSVDQLDREFVHSARHLHLSSLFLQTALHAGLPALLDDVKAGGMTVSLDTNDDPDDTWAGILPDVLQRTDILLPNEDEVLRITRTNSVEAALDALRDIVPTVVVKCGARGALIQHGNERQWAAPTPVQSVDTIGAGDSFDAGFLHAWLHGATVAEAAEFGNRTGALSVLRPGGTEAFRDRDLREQFLATGRAPNAQATP
ncbi:carbohydrate kinase family protein [Terriglobus aquaticus]|uniref:Carbohydrate kinase family protein n=1 Tax=Terriglobus aquaticus TaxID=940139 RepID=A0ABW9KNR5_9BACT|nr:sugar kinase [Terriglobus aquaticus]